MKAIVFALLLTVTASVNATKIYMGVFDTSGPFASHVTAILRPCDQTEGNAMVVNGDIVIAGCWQEQGEKVTINRLDGTFLASFDKSGFKLVADKGVSQPPTNQSKNSAKTMLNCLADAWAGDVEVERDQEGRLKSVVISGETVRAQEASSAINFSYNGLDISLSTVSGMFSYDTSPFKKLLGAAVRRGTGRCIISDSAKKF